MSSKITIAPTASGLMTGVCGATSLESKEGYCVKQHTDGTIILCASAGEPGYILTQGAGVGKHVTFALPGVQYCGIMAAAITTYNNEYATDTAGKLAAASGGQFVIFRNTGIAGADEFALGVTAGYRKGTS
jgi:hypothetical protein